MSVETSSGSRSPFVGLTPYSEDDARFFFGRERETRLIVANLFASRLTVLYGASGVGKSSILKAGVMGQMRRRAADRGDSSDIPNLVMVHFNEWHHRDRLERLRAQIHLAACEASPVSADVRTGEQATLRDLLGAMTKSQDCDFMLILDQFEDYFQYHQTGETVDELGRQLAELIGDETLPVNVLLAVRDDTLSRLDRFKTLIPSLFSNYLRLPHLSSEAARDAVCKPLDEWNRLEALGSEVAPMEIEDSLVSSIIDSVRTGRVVLEDATGTAPSRSSGIEAPYLQLVLTRLWREEVTAGSKQLRSSTLRQLGGADAIVRDHVDTFMWALSPAEQEICCAMFKFLVTPSGTKIAHSVADLAAATGVDAERMHEILEHLSKSEVRILAPVAPSPESPSLGLYEIYHDSLARAVLEWRQRYLKNQQIVSLDNERRRADKERNRRRLSNLMAALLVLLLLAGVALAQFAHEKDVKINTLSTQVKRKDRDFDLAIAKQEQSDALLAKTEREVAKKKNEAADLSVAIADLKKSKEDLTKRSLELKQEAQALNTRLSNLNAEKEGLETKNHTLAEQILNEHCDRSLNQEREIERLKTRVEYLESELKKAQPQAGNGPTTNTP